MTVDIGDRLYDAIVTVALIVGVVVIWHSYLAH